MALLLGLLGTPARGAPPLQHELRLSASGASDVGGVLEASTKGAWLGLEARYAVRFLGPLWLHLGLETASAGGRSVGSASPLDLTRLAGRAGAGVSWPLGRRLELGLEGALGLGRLHEDFSPRGGSGPIRSRISGIEWSVSASASFALGRRLRLPVGLRLQRLVYAGPLEGPLHDIDATQLGLTAGLAWRLGKAWRP